ncbi:MAG: transketolase [Alphaproteobacteria bacterium]|nr:transketolase [Alphaproteobacteria bacterium]PHY01714.1 MAG: transketolase [Rhodospirillaceae bacterium]
MVSAQHLANLKTLEKKILWLATWMIHNANNIRPSVDGIKVGGHQASCASLATVMTALYLHTLRPQDRVAVKPHAGPIFHAIQYLLGNQKLEHMQNFRAFGGVQPYPSRTKDKADVDFSTGSVGLGVAETLFASLVQDYLRLHELTPATAAQGRMIALLGDAELDEGNIYEALLEGWKHEVKNVWWIVDYNRQSLDGVVNDQLFKRITGFFQTVDWNVILLKYGLKLEAAFKTPIGPALKAWIDDCPNQLYSALTFQGGAAWREHLSRDLKAEKGLEAFLKSHDDAGLHALMTNLGGHDMEAIIHGFEQAAKSDTPTCFIAYTIKGFGLPLAGHKDNHAGIMNDDQIAKLQSELGIAAGQEWRPFAGIEKDEKGLRAFLDAVPFKSRVRSDQKTKPAAIAVHELVPPKAERMSTQEAFGKIMNELGRGQTPLAARIVTTSPDVTVSTNLGGWVNQRSPFHTKRREDIFRQMHVPSPQKWAQDPKGQHIELGIAENNLFLLLGALGLATDLFDARLLPVGTLYDPFIARGLDAMTYAAYQDARFMLVSTPSGITLGAEGGAHQSVFTPLIGIGHANLAYFEPAYADELAAIMTWGFDHMQRPDGCSIYLRLSTRPLKQPGRVMTPDLRGDILSGAYWVKRPAPGSDLVLAYCGVTAPEVHAALEAMADDVPGAGVLAITSPDRLYAGFRAAAQARRAGQQDAESFIEKLLAPLSPSAAIVTVHDGHPAALGWLGSVRGHRCQALGVDRFGQAGNIASLFKEYGIDTETVIDAVADLILAESRTMAPRLAAE